MELASFLSELAKLLNFVAPPPLWRAPAAAPAQPPPGASAPPARARAPRARRRPGASPPPGSSRRPGTPPRGSDFSSGIPGSPAYPVYPDPNDPGLGIPKRDPARSSPVPERTPEPPRLRRPPSRSAPRRIPTRLRPWPPRAGAWTRSPTSTATTTRSYHETTNTGVRQKFTAPQSLPGS